MMKHYWSLKPPTLIVSVVGGNRDGTINVEVKKALEEGFAKVGFNVFLYFCAKISRAVWVVCRER